MKKVLSSESTLRCSCGNEFPTRWSYEGKMGLRLKNENGTKKLEKYCVNCADDSEYENLLNKFSQFIQAK